MKTLNLVITLSGFLLLTVSSHLSAGVEVETPRNADKSAQAEVLVAAIKTAHQHHDLNALMDLVFWQDVTPETKNSIRKSFKELLERRIKNVYVAPVPKDQMTEYTLGSVRYKINLKPAGLLHIHLSTAKDGVTLTSYVVGVHRGKYFIATAAPTK